MFNVRSGHHRPFRAVDGKSLPMEIDTGASCIKL